MATYMTPASCSTVHTARASGRIGTTSDSPTLVSCARREVDQLEEGALPLALERGERAGPDLLDREEQVGEREDEHGEAGTDREQLVLGDPVVLEHVRDERVGRVEVEDRQGAVREDEDGRPVVDQAPDLEHRCGQGEPDRQPGERRGAAHGEHRGDHGREAEQRDDGPAPVATTRAPAAAGSPGSARPGGRPTVACGGWRATGRLVTGGPAGPPRSSSWPHFRGGWATMPVCRAPCSSPSSPAPQCSSSAASPSCGHPTRSTRPSPRSRCPRCSTPRSCAACPRGPRWRSASRCSSRVVRPWSWWPCSPSRSSSPTWSSSSARCAAPSRSTAAASGPSATRG